MTPFGRAIVSNGAGKAVRKAVDILPDSIEGVTTTAVDPVLDEISTLVAKETKGFWPRALRGTQVRETRSVASGLERRA